MKQRQKQAPASTSRTKNDGKRRPDRQLQQMKTTADCHNLIKSQFCKARSNRQTREMVLCYHHPENHDKNAVCPKEPWLKKTEQRQKKASPTSRTAENNGKKRPSSSPAATKKPSKSKYTIVRTPQDLQSLEQARTTIQQHSPGYSLKTDSEVYRLLPEFYISAVKREEILQQRLDELTAEQAQLEDLRTSFCHILNSCGIKTNIKENRE